MNRGLVIAAASTVASAELAVSLWYPVPVYVASGGAAIVALVVGLVAAWRRNRRPPAALLLDERDRSFRTPVYASGLLMGLAGLQIMVFFLAVIRETWVGLFGAGLFAMLLVGQWRALRYGYGLTLRAGGIEAAKSAGTLLIPWQALAAQPPDRGDNWWQIKLTYARPDLIIATGRVHERAVVVFEGADPDFVAAAIATYATEPGRRYAIGTKTELERLQAGMPGPPHGIRKIVEPASTPTSVRRLVVGLALLLGASTVAGATDRWWEVLAMPFGWAGAHQIYLAVAGWRAARRARRPPTSETAMTVGSR